MKRPAIAVLLAAAALVLACGGGSNHATEASPDALRVPELPPVPPVPELPGDPVTPQKIALGTDIFFDKRLSGSGHTSCQACHAHTISFQDNLPLSTPDRSYPGDTPLLPRNTLSFMNIVYAPVFRWDGSHTDIVQVMAFPLAEPNMNVAKLPVGSDAADVGAAQPALYRKLTVDLPGYQAVYRDAFGVDIATLDAKAVWALTGRALRAFVTQAVSRDAPFDRWNAGDDSAMDASAVRGLAVFKGTGRCIICHHGPFFTDFSFHNLSTAWRSDGTRGDQGRFLVTGDHADRGKFLTPTLRQTYDTSPYFHDGSRPGLRDVITHLSSPAVTADPNHDPVFNTPLALSSADTTDLIAFIRALRAPMTATITPPSAFP
jgi:cytochrome c peroxidase